MKFAQDPAVCGWKSYFESYLPDFSPHALLSLGE